MISRRLDSYFTLLNLTFSKMCPERNLTTKRFKEDTRRISMLVCRGQNCMRISLQCDIRDLSYCIIIFFVLRKIS